MNIGILILAAGNKAGGPEVYETNILRALAAQDKQNTYHVFTTSEAAVEACNVKQDNFIFHILRPSLRVINLSLTLPIWLRTQKIDVLHATYVPPPQNVVPLVFSHHCFSTFQHPEFYPPMVRLRLNYLIKHGLRTARRVLCVSDDVRQRTLERFGHPADRFEVIHHGVATAFRPLDQAACARTVRERWGVDGPYLLTVGKLEKRKNFARTLEAFARFRKSQGKDVRLVMAGKRTWHSAELEKALDQSGVRDAVVETGYLGEADMACLYNAATAFVFPSLWEGFGMPAVEAMACGTPVIASNISSLPEVTGGNALLVDPYDVGAIENAMARVCLDPLEARRLSDLGRAWATQFTWQEAARKTLAAYHHAVESSPVR